MSNGNKVLVAGASGLIGVAAIEAFLSAGWNVVGVSRRKPQLRSGRDFQFVPLDLRDRKAAHDTLSALTGITHIAYTAIHENADDLVSGWSNPAQIEINNAMLRNVIEPLVAGQSPLRHVSILQGTKAYGVHLHPIAVPARESDPRDDHANFFFDQQDYLRDAGIQHGFSYTVLRPQLVTGKTPGALNVLPAIGVYAAIRREKGEPFSFPGGPSFVWEMADADLVGQVMAWAADTPQAANQIFNITNGDVFAWRSVWPALAQTLGVKTGDDAPTSIAQYIRDNADVWQKIVARYGLASGDLQAFVGQGDQHADFAFAYGAPAGPVAFVSTVKLRKAGFNAAVDTRDAFCEALQSFIDRKLLPPAL
ncbi:MAG TPA: SDR family oxidoreductase [Paraburkholderia sp.]|jgi:nucleoside-diphosphate-sugar epimerase|nr:SDR family oxidoreductase [Paraburkholderia sp.]